MPEPGTSTEPDQNENELKKKRNVLVTKIAIGVLIVSLLVALYWLLFLRGWESTDDSYVNGNMINLTPQISATAVAYYADNTDYVEEGQLLVQLDPTDYQIAFDKAKSDLALAVLQVLEFRAQAEQKRSIIDANKALLTKARQDFQNRFGLIDIKAISKEDLQHAQADLEAQAANVRMAEFELVQYEIAGGQGPVGSHPAVEKAKNQLRDAFVQLKRTSVYAPANGYVAMRNVQVGEYVYPEKILLAIIPLDQIWVDANFKENQLSNMRIGQPVEVTADMYGGGVTFKGTLVGLNAGTGSVFSLLPPQNATGNWIKIVQRVAVKISLDPGQIKEHPLLLGLSMYVSVDISDTSGKLLAEVPSKQKLPSTWVYKIDMKEVDELIEAIIEENSRS